MGTNHKMESVFLDSLPLKDRDIASEILSFHLLDEIIEFRLNGVPECLNKAQSRTAEQWRPIINNIILTKISYFTPHKNMSLKHIQLLIKMISFAFNKEGLTLNQVSKKFHASHPIFANWANDLEKIRLEKISK